MNPGIGPNSEMGKKRKALMDVYRFQRFYVGPLQAVITDWAGTIVDYGSFAPVVAISRAFKAFEVEVTAEQVRQFMGSHKREHIQNVGELPAVSEAWQRVHGRAFSSEDGDVVFRKFLEIDVECVEEHSEVIPGAVDAFKHFRDRGMKIGTTSGYTREIMDLVAEQARKQGLEADHVMSASDTSAARPSPWMCYHLAEKLNFYPMAAAVKIGDTPIDMEEGLNAGMWTIGLACSGNLLGMTRDEVDALGETEIEQKLTPVHRKLAEAGAHYIVNSIADCPAVLDEIEHRLARGERP